MSTHEHFKLEVKARLGILELLSQYGVKTNGGGKNKFKICCPLHGEKTPSCQIDVLQNSYYCFGCGKHGDVFRFIETYENVDFKQALTIAAQMVGMSKSAFIPDPARAKRRAQQAAKVAQKQLIEAEKKGRWNYNRIEGIVARCKPAAGTLVEDYLKSRYIYDDFEALANLRYCSELDYYNTDTGQWLGLYKAMVAYITDVDRKIIGLHITYLTNDGTKLKLYDEARKLLPAKKMIGSHMDGVIRLCSSDRCKTMWLCEGIETALSLSAIHKVPVWAVGSSANFATKALEKMDITSVGLGLDNDSKDQKNYRDIWMKAAATWNERGWTVRRLVPDYGFDFNDQLKDIELNKRHSTHG